MAVAGELYKEILYKLEGNAYDNFANRAYLTKVSSGCSSSLLLSSLELSDTTIYEP